MYLSVLISLVLYSAKVMYKFMLKLTNFNICHIKILPHLKFNSIPIF